MQLKALSPPAVMMPNGNLVNLEETSEISLMKDEFIASHSKQNI